MEQKKYKLPILIIAKHRSLAKDLVTDLTGTHTIDDSIVIVNATATSSTPDESSFISKVIDGYFTAICFYVTEESDLEALQPSIESHTAFPIKVLVYDPDVNVSSIQLPKAPKTVKEEIVKAFKIEAEKLDEQLRTTFDEIDKDKSGKIDAEELVEASEKLGTSIYNSDALEIIAQIDQDNDNKISFNEFKHWWSSGRTLFGLNLNKFLKSKLSKEDSAKKEDQNISKKSEPKTLHNKFHISYNGDKKMKTHFIGKFCTNGNEYDELKKAYFPKPFTKIPRIVIVLSCKDVSKAKDQITKIIEEAKSIISMVNPDIDEENPFNGIEVTVKGSSIFIRIENKMLKSAFKELKYEFSSLFLKNQSIIVKGSFVPEVSDLSKYEKPLIDHLLEGFIFEFTTNILEKNIDFVMNQWNDSLKSIIPMLTINLDVNVNENLPILDILKEKIIKMSKDEDILNYNLANLKKEKIDQYKEEIESVFPAIKDLYNFMKDQFISMELLIGTNLAIVSLFGTAPGLHEFLSMD